MMLGVNDMFAFKKRFDSVIVEKGVGSELMSFTEFLKM